MGTEVVLMLNQEECKKIISNMGGQVLNVEYKEVIAPIGSDQGKALKPKG